MQNQTKRIPPLDGLGKAIFRDLFRNETIRIKRNPIGITITFFGKEVRLIHLRESEPRLSFFYERCKSPTVFKARMQILGNNFKSTVISEAYVLKIRGQFRHVHPRMDHTEVMLG